MYGIRRWILNIRSVRRRPVSGETEDYFKSLDMPVSLKELGVDPASFKVMAEKCSGGGARRLTGIRELDEEDMIRIYEMAMGE